MEQAKDLTTVDQKLRAVEIAASTVHQPYNSGRQAAGDPYDDKDMKEILKRAERIIGFITDTEEKQPANLINKLREVLCSEKQP